MEHTSVVRLTRRDALLAAMAAPLAGSTAVPLASQVAVTPSHPDLRTAARMCGRLFGAAVQWEQLRSDAAFRSLILQQCDSVTPELALKWGAVQPTPDRFDFRAMDHIAGFARQNRLWLHGHTLLWHRSLPDWALPSIIEAKSWDPVHRYFEAVINRYRDFVSYWDVVNEPIDLADGPDGLRKSPLFAGFGRDYIRRALDSARSLAPQGKLLINDYGLEYPDKNDQDRRDALLRLIDDLLARQAPLDGIGIQAHLDLSRGPINQQVLAGFLRELADRGLLIVVTELDVKEADPSLPIDQRDLKVAQTIHPFLEVMLEQPAVRGFTTWGMSDRYSWLNEDDGGMRPGRNRGLPFDTAMQPKPFFYAASEVFTQQAFAGRPPGAALPASAGNAPRWRK